MNRFFLLFLFICTNVFAQITMKPKDSLVRDPFFSQAKTPTKTEKVQHIHSDKSGVDPEKYDGNFYFSGNVKFSHQGSVLTADEVVVYQEDNFVKAFGNVKLVNSDGSIITAGAMEYDGNSQRGIARKNVVLTDPKQTIKTEILYYDRISNQAYFNTGGTIYANNSVTYAKTATYNVSTKIIDLTGDLNIDNPEYTLVGRNIIQNQNTNVATINGPTTITNKVNPSNQVYTEKGTYNQNTGEVYMNKNSRINYNGKILTGDNLYFNRNTGFGTGKGNVLLRDPEENRYISGGYGEIYEKKDSAMITEKPLAVKILEKDSMYFSAEKIITYKSLDSLLQEKSHLRAFYKARFFKSNAQARADSISFNETDGVMHMNVKPILWSGAKQVTGDKIEAYFDTQNEFIDSLKVIGNAFAISKADSLNNKDEFNQVKGKLMTVYYEENDIKLANAIGNAQAITYADDEDEKTGELTRIGVAITTCGIIEALFEAKKVQVISCNVGAEGSVYPMSKISKEQRFFPDFNWNTKDRPRKWQDVYLDSPEYEEVIYESDDALYNAAQAEIEKAKAAEEAKKPKRERK